LINRRGFGPGTFTQENDMKTYKAATFNGNIVIGKGETMQQAKADAQSEAAKMGSCIRKRIR
jgi:hypothetical protein